MYILSKDIDDIEYEDYQSRAEAYNQYLDSIRDKLKLSPEGFVFEEWYRDTSSHRCPHDAWLERISISENDSNEVQIQLRLLGAYHDGNITFTYNDVQYYRLDRHKSSTVKSSHGDLRYEEFRLDEDENIIHEYDWYTLGENALFLIACKSIDYQWDPLREGEKANRKPEWRT
jgi:hypothetical protein